MEPVHGSGSSKHRNLAKKSKSSSSSSSSSSEDFFQLDANELSKSIADHGDAQLASRADLDLSTEFALASPADSGPLQSDRLSTVDMFGPPTPGVTQSPPLQVMGKSDVTDPYRIPSSVFDRSKSTTPMEWSVASNESLFSIHVGNSSFSRDHVFLMGRSGELTNYPGPEGFPPAPSAMKAGMENNPGVTEAANAETMKEVLRAAADEHVKAEAPAPGGTPHSISRHSDGSGASIHSFAFPILTEGRNGSVKVESDQTSDQQQQQTQPLAAEAAPAATNAKWFPCFSCCPFCC